MPQERKVITLDDLKKMKEIFDKQAIPKMSPQENEYLTEMYKAVRDLRRSARKGDEVAQSFLNFFNL